MSYLLVGRRGPAVQVRVLRRALDGLVLLVDVARHDPLVILRGLEEPLQEVARDVHVLAELPDAEAPRHADGMATVRPGRRRVEADQLGDRKLLLLGDHVAR